MCVRPRSRTPASLPWEYYDPIATAEEPRMRIEHALEIHGTKKVQVRGFLLRCDQEPLLLCAELLESYPPQCGGPSLVVEGLDMDTLADISRSDDCAWSARPVELQGVVDNGVLQVTAAQG